MKRGRPTSQPPSSRFLVAGIVIVLMGAAAWAALATWGQNADPWSGPGTSAVRVASAGSEKVCSDAYYPRPSLPTCEFGSVGPYYSAPYYDAAAHATVVVEPPVSVLLTEGFLGSPVPVSLPGCAPWATFPASGDQVAIGCEGPGTNVSLDFLDATTGNESGTLLIGNFSWFDPEAYAWDASDQLLYLVAGQTVSTGQSSESISSLLTVNVGSRSLAHSVALPVDTNGYIALDPGRDAILFVDPRNGTLDEIDPSTGGSRPVLAITDLVQASLTSDPADGDLLVGALFQNGSAQTLEVDPATWQIISVLPIPAWCGGLADPVEGVIYLSDCATVTELNASTLRVLGEVGLTPYVWEGGWAVLPGTSQLLLGQNGLSGTVAVSQIGLETYTIPGPAFHTVPLLGTAVPEAVFLIGIMIGGTMILVLGIPELRALRRYRNERADAALTELISKPKVPSEDSP